MIGIHQCQTLGPEFLEVILGFLEEEGITPRCPFVNINIADSDSVVLDQGVIDVPLSQPSPYFLPRGAVDPATMEKKRKSISPLPNTKGINVNDDDDFEDITASVRVKKAKIKNTDEVLNAFAHTKK